MGNPEEKLIEQVRDYFITATETGEYLHMADELYEQGREKLLEDLDNNHLIALDWADWQEWAARSAGDSCPVWPSVPFGPVSITALSTKQPPTHRRLKNENHRSDTLRHRHHHRHQRP